MSTNTTALGGPTGPVYLNSASSLVGVVGPTYVLEAAAAGTVLPRTFKILNAGMGLNTALAQTNKVYAV